MNILVVDDDAIQRELLAGFLEHHGYSVTVAVNGRDAIDTFKREFVHLALVDQRMPEMTGDVVLREMKAINPAVRFIMITAYGDVATAVSAMKLGADEFLEKPVDLPLLLDKIRQLEFEMGVEEDAAVVKNRVQEDPLPISIIAESQVMKRVLSMTRRVAGSPWAVLIRGETGTGKELVARLIHVLSPRREGPFVDLNCSAIPENLFESELFGHEKGAFTGALNLRRGRFEQADGGTILLDEIGEMPMLLQPKILRVLQDQKVFRLGGEKPVPVDVRLISATNRDLKQMVMEGRFREDLFYRLKVLEIVLPPLRHRREDIPALADHFLKKYATPQARFTDEALDAIIKYPFPGNVREVEHMVQRTITLARGPVFQAADLPEEIQRHRLTNEGPLTERLESLEKTVLGAALEKAGWNQTKAARELGISERVLRYKMKKHGIERKP